MLPTRLSKRNHAYDKLYRLLRGYRNLMQLSESTWWILPLDYWARTKGSVCQRALFLPEMEHIKRSRTQPWLGFWRDWNPIPFIGEALLKLRQKQLRGSDCLLGCQAKLRGILHFRWRIWKSHYCSGSSSTSWWRPLHVSFAAIKAQQCMGVRYIPRWGITPQEIGLPNCLQGCTSGRNAIICI